MFDDVGAARLIQELVSQRIDLEMVRTAFGNSLKVGPVEEIDAEKGYRLKLGEDDEGNPFLSPWYPHPESGGQTTSWMPLSKGQVVGILNPSGDATQGVLFRGGFNGENGPPSEDLLANVLKGLGVTITVKDGVVTIEGNFVVKGNVDLGDIGGPPVARIGDKVNVLIGSSKGLWPIVEGSSKVRAAG